MPKQWAFFSLPRELRDIIYEYYVLEDGGYRFNYDSGKLRVAADRPIDLSFMYTCTLVATEMRGVALGTNTVTFSTAYSDSERIKAGRFNLVVERLDHLRNDVISAMIRKYPELQSCVDPSIDAELFGKYPQFVTVRGLKDGVVPGWVPSREARSTRTNFVDDAFKLLCKDANFLETLVGICRSRTTTLIRSTLIHSVPTPWKIVSEDEVLEMDKVMPVPDRRVERREFWKRVYQRWSACAVAIQFLQSNSPSTRLQIRNIVLEEDRPSVAFPECHALGLIPFCLENPRLYIERRLNLWRTVLASARQQSLFDMVHGGRSTNPNRVADDYLIPQEICEGFHLWISEALALPKAGMPIKSFSLVFDGDPIPERSSEIFECLKEGAARQIARDQLSEQYRTLSLKEKQRKHPWFMLETFPEVIQDIIENRSFIRCNFPLGCSLDVKVKSVLEKSRNLSSRDWWRWFWDHFPQKEFRTAAPLPNWVDLSTEEVLPEEYLQKGFDSPPWSYLYNHPTQ